MKAEACGYLSLIPELNAAEFEYLSAFVLSRRHAGRSSPYDVPDNPHEHSVVRVGPPPAPGLPATISEPEWDRDLYNEPIDGQPSLWCPWEPRYSRTRSFYEHLVPEFMISPTDDMHLLLLLKDIRRSLRL